MKKLCIAELLAIIIALGTFSATLFWQGFYLGVSIILATCVVFFAFIIATVLTKASLNYLISPVALTAIAAGMTTNLIDRLIKDNSGIVSIIYTLVLVVAMIIYSVFAAKKIKLPKLKVYSSLAAEYFLITIPIVYTTYWIS